MHHSMPWCTRHCSHAFRPVRTRWSSSQARPHSMVRSLPNGQDAFHHDPSFITQNSYLVMAATLSTIKGPTCEEHHGLDCDCCIFMIHSYHDKGISFSVNFGSRSAKGDGRATGARSTAKPFLSTVSGGGRGAGSGARHAKDKSYRAKPGSSGGPPATRSTPEWHVGFSSATTNPTTNKYMDQHAQTGAYAAVAMPTTGSRSSLRLLAGLTSAPRAPLSKPEETKADQQHQKVQLRGTQPKFHMGTVRIRPDKFTHRDFTDSRNRDGASKFVLLTRTPRFIRVVQPSRTAYSWLLQPLHSRSDPILLSAFPRMARCFYKPCTLHLVFAETQYYIPAASVFRYTLGRI